MANEADILDQQKQLILSNTKTVDDIKPTDDYSLLVAQLTKINSLDRYTKNSSGYDPTQQSSRMRLIKTSEDSYIAPTIEKDQYYGIVMDFRKNSANDAIEIFVDVPPKIFKRFEHPDVFADPNFNLEQHLDLIFTPSDIDIGLTKTPIIGGICIVSFDKNYPNNTSGNFFHGMKYTVPTIKASKGASSLIDKIVNAFSALTGELTGPGIVPQSTVYKEKDIIPSIPVVGGRAGSVYGGRIHPIYKVPKNHGGIDISGPTPGSKPPVLSMTQGIVIYAAFGQPKTGFDRYGNVVAVNTGGKVYVYGHLDSIKVSRGQTVSKGDIIGIMGNTGGSAGVHLHAEIRKSAASGFENTIDPAPFIKELNSNNNPVVTASTGITQQSVPQAHQQSNSTNKSGSSSSKPTNKPKLLLLDLKTDQSPILSLGNKRGVKNIKIREDIISDIQEIKQQLNNYNIPLCCEAVNISLSNRYISELAMVGLEIKLNRHSGMSSYSDLQHDDYFIGPDYNHKIGSYYKLKVYGNAKRVLNLNDNNYKIINTAVDVYDIRESENKKEPIIKKIFKPLIDITKIFEDYGFIQKLPEQKFFKNSDYNISNWFIFYKPSKIVKGYTYKELLETVYSDNGESIWKENNLTWDGYKFV